MGFIRIGVKVITSFCKCPNIRTTLQYNIVHWMSVCRNLFTTIWKILSKHSAHETILCFRQEWKQAKKMFSLFCFILFYGENVENKKGKKKNYAIYFMFSLSTNSFVH